MYFFLQRATDEDPTIQTYVADDEWRRVLVRDSDSKPLVAMGEKDWKGLFAVLEVPHEPILF